MSFRNNLFALNINQKKLTTDIVMQLFTSRATTQHFPRTLSVLEKYLPSVLKSKCFNYNNYSFSKEVQQTEIGHLFEHILLEYLSYYKNLKGSGVVYNGVTEWNWKKDAVGTFHINIDAGYEDKEVFNLALEKSMILISKILDKLV